jgi:hypothetical protein
MRSLPLRQVSTAFAFSSLVLGLASGALAAPSKGPARSSIKAIHRATDHLAEKLGVAATSIRTKDVDAVDWEDESLGCPEPDKSYAPKTIPGWRIVLGHGKTLYTYHSDTDGSDLLLCAEGPEIVAAPPDEKRGPITDASPAGRRLARDFARVAGRRADEFLVRSSEAVEWKSADLDCPENATRPASEKSPGFRIVLKDRKGGEIELHADRPLSRWLECRPDGTIGLSGKIE